MRSAYTSALILFATLASLGIANEEVRASAGDESKNKQQPSILETRKDLQCLPGKYGLEFMENRRLQNENCMQHAARTCCDDKDAEQMNEQWESLAKQSRIS